VKVYGALERASMESLGANPAAGTLGRFWWNSAEGKAYFDKSANNRPFLLNDDKAILGNSGTAADNIRMHRGAAGVIQLLSGADTTAEGTLSTALNQLSARHENYTNASKPAVGNAGRMIWVTDLVTFLGDTGSAWVQVGGGALAATGSTGTPQNIVAGTGIAYVETTGSRQVWFVATASGEVIVTANPQISACTTVGKELWVVGTSDANYPVFADGTGLRLKGNWYGYNGAILKLMWDGSAWLEIGRV
jgi:hypothetical protein